jgi:DNA-binding CsgD family transcriptional regulator
MQVTTGRRPSSVDAELSHVGHASFDADRAWTLLLQLHDIERDLIEALAVARESIARCEQALARLAHLRERSSPRVHSAGVVVLTGSDACLARVDASDCFPDGASHSVSDGNRLTVRESEILRLIAIGMSNRMIADRLCLSPRTVERHIANIYLKINAHNRAEAIVYALREGFARTRNGIEPS